MKTVHKYLIVVTSMIVLALAILGGIFFTKANFYKTHFFPGTKMNGVDVSKMTCEEATDKVGKFVADYLLSIQGRDGVTGEILGPDIHYEYVPNGEIDDALLAQNPYQWIGSKKRATDNEIELNTTFDEELLKEAVKAQPFMQKEQMVEPVDATIQWTDEDGYQLLPEVMGSKLKLKTVYQAVRLAVEQGETEMSLEDLYINPQITGDDAHLNECMKTIEKYFGTTITYTFGDQDPLEISGEQIQSWLTVDEDFRVSVDDQKVTNVVQSLASTYNTYGDKRKFKTSMGDKIYVSGGDYGWVIDKEKEKAQIYEDLETGGTIERETIYNQTAKKYGSNDIGSTYVEVDYTNQHMWYYKKGKLVLESDFVSGNLSRNNGSPDGVFKIVYKERNATLVGEGYSSPVKYFMPFAYNVGFHDASWRNKFGEQIYLMSGSHGCVNLPPETAKELYETLEVGTPVVAYYREKVYLTAENARISNAASYISEDDYKELLKTDPTAVNPKPKKN